MKHGQNYKTFPLCIRLTHCTQRLDKRRTNSYSIPGINPPTVTFHYPVVFLILDLKRINVQILFMVNISD